MSEPGKLGQGGWDPGEVGLRMAVCSVSTLPLHPVFKLGWVAPLGSCVIPDHGPGGETPWLSTFLPCSSSLHV